MGERRSSKIKVSEEGSNKVKRTNRKYGFGKGSFTPETLKMSLGDDLARECRCEYLVSVLIPLMQVTVVLHLPNVNRAGTQKIH